MTKQPVQKYLFRVLVLSLIVILMGGGIAFLYQWHQGATPGHASSSGDNVVGPPSLPASLVNTIFRELGSPMAGTGQAVEAASRAENIDDAFALAVWWTETNDGEAGVGLHDLNPGSVRGSVGYPSAYDGYTIYPSFTAAVDYWFSMMKRAYIDRGLTTVYSISHPYVGTSTSYLWAGKVTALMQRYRAEAPAPALPAKPTPTVSVNMKRVVKAIVQQAQQQNASGVALAATPVLQQQNTQQASTSAISGLGSSTNQILMLLGLLLVLASGLWIWRSSSRRSAGKVQMQPSVQPVGDIWEQLRASQQQPSAFFSSISGQLRMTGDLATSAPNTESLVRTGALLSAYNSGALRSPDTFPPGQMPFPAPPTPRPAFTGQFPRFNVSQPEYPLTGRLPTSGVGLPSLPSRPVSRQPYSSRLWSPQPDTGQLRPLQLVGVGSSGGRSSGLLSRYREMQTQGERVERY